MCSQRWSKFLILATITLVFFTLQIQGYIQSVTFHEKADGSGNYFVFVSQVPNISVHSSLRNCEKYCVRGGWYFYTDENYQGSASNHVYHEETCREIEEWGLGSRSFRHFGSSQTNVDALTLFRTLFVDNPIEVINPAKGDLSFETYGIIGQTGKGPWTLFEGNDFDGPRVCLPGTGKNGTYSFQVWREYPNLTQIGSVVRGCFPGGFGDDLEINRLRTEYRKRQTVKNVN